MEIMIFLLGKMSLWGLFLDDVLWSQRKMEKNDLYFFVVFSKTLFLIMSNSYFMYTVFFSDLLGEPTLE